MEKSKSSRSRSRIFWAIGIVVVVLVVGYYFLNARTANRRANFTRRTAAVSTVTVVDTVQASGNLNAFQSASLSWKTSGAIKTINVKIGDRVHKGDVLATLDNASVPQSVISAQADLIPAQQA